jgi:hypothetical protein
MARKKVSKLIYVIKTTAVFIIVFPKTGRAFGFYKQTNDLRNWKCWWHFANIPIL